jgi:hypothetical protein
MMLPVAALMLPFTGFTVANAVSLTVEPCVPT